MGNHTFMQGLVFTVAVGLLTIFGSIRAEAATPIDIKVFELEKTSRLKVGILSSPAFDPNSVRGRGLVVGFRNQGRDGGFVRARWLSNHRDANGDGRKDRVAVFKLSKDDAQALRSGLAKQIEVRGIYKDGIFEQEFVGRAIVGDSDDPASSCTDVVDENKNVIGERCIWTSAADSSFKPIYVQTLLSTLNDSLASKNLEIVQDSAVVLEAYGGQGAAGANEKNSNSGLTAKGGDPGAAGYARTILKVSDISDELWIYPGQRGSVSGKRAGGGSTVISDVNLSTITTLGSTNADDIVNAGIYTLAGGGGGGGNGAHSDGGEETHHGGDGGQGGIAVADTAGNQSVAGSDGTKGNPGRGGSCSGGGTGGGHPGSNGIGGPGGQSQENDGSGTGGFNYESAMWEGWLDNNLYNSGSWTWGAGGYNANGGGRGAGGCGGGASANGSGDGHKGGGGGGGSVARQATVDADSISADLIYGEPTSANGYTSQIVVTFELQTKS